MKLEHDGRINLSQVSAVVLENSQHAADLMGQMLKGLGVGEVQRFTSVEACQKWLKTQTPDLMIVEPRLPSGDAYQLLYDVRHASDTNLAYIPIILASSYSTSTEVKRGRDTGANFFVAKPISPRVLIERLIWIVRDPRPFVEVGRFLGPDRRFKFEGPPPGSDGRRSGDLTSPLGEADTPNLSQDEIDKLIKPQRAAL